MTAARPRRAAIVGFHGFGNLGDEAVLAGIERVLEPAGTEVSVVFGGGEPDGRVFPHARRIQPWRLLPTPRAMRELRRTDLLILGGGGLFNDHWPAVIPRYLAWVMAGRLAGARVAWIGVGVGPIRRRAWRRLARLAARLSGPVLVRDARSAALLGGGRAQVVPDPALFLDPPADVTPRAVLGLVVRPSVGDSREANERVAAVLERLAEVGRARGLEPEILLMAPRVDRAFAGELSGRVGAPVREPDDFADALRQLASCTAVASFRLHGLLLSALAGVPCVPIAYDAKVTAAADQLGLGELVIDPDDPAVAERALAGAMDPEVRRLVATRVAAQRATLADVRRRLA